MADELTAAGREPSATRVRVALTAVFVTHAVVAGSWGPQAPAIKDRLHLDDGALGLALTAMAVGMFAGTRLAGWSLGRVGPRTVVGAALPGLALALAAVGRAPTAGTLVAAMVAMGLALGVLDVAMNAEAVTVENRGGRPLLGQLHGTWCVGLLAAGGLAAGATTLGWDVATHFTVVAVAAVLLGAVATVALPPGRAQMTEQSVGPELTDRSVRRYGPVAVIGLVAGASFAAEGAAIDWSAVYLRDHIGTTPAVAAAGFVAFAAGMSVGRFGADRLVHRRGAVRVVRTGGLVAAAGVVLALAVPATAAVLTGLALTGLALAPVVPVSFRAAGAGPDGHRHLSWVVTIAYGGTVLGPAVIGLAARSVGLRPALGVVVALALAIAAGARHLSAGDVVMRRDRPVTTSGS